MCPTLPPLESSSLANGNETTNDGWALVQVSEDSQRTGFVPEAYLGPIESCTRAERDDRIFPNAGAFELDDDSSMPKRAHDFAPKEASVEQGSRTYARCGYVIIVLLSSSMTSALKRPTHGHSTSFIRFSRHGLVFRILPRHSSRHLPCMSSMITNRGTRGDDERKRDAGQSGGRM